MYKIQKDISPLHGARTRWAVIASDMVAGDSVLVGSPNEATGLKVALKRLGKKTRSQKETDEKGGPVRVWCILSGKGKK